MSETITIDPRKDDTCQRCGERKAEINWSDCGLCFARGYYQRWCAICAAEKRLEHAKERAAAIPGLEAELEALAAIPGLEAELEALRRDDPDKAQ